MTIAEYKTKLTTHATTAGLGFMFGWFDEINAELRDSSLTSPFVVVEPTQWGLNDRWSKFDISFKCNGYIDHATSRESSFDSLVTKLNAFITAINTDTQLRIDQPNIIANIIDFGSVVENYYVIGFETTIGIEC